MSHPVTKFGFDGAFNLDVANVHDQLPLPLMAARCAVLTQRDTRGQAHRPLASRRARIGWGTTRRAGLKFRGIFETCTDDLRRIHDPG